MPEPASLGVVRIAVTCIDDPQRYATVGVPQHDVPPKEAPEMSRSHSSTGASGSSKSTSSGAKAPSGSSSQGGKHIYALVDPRSGKERYVGAAADPARRLDAHIREARGRCETAKCQWIRELDCEGLRPHV